MHRLSGCQMPLGRHQTWQKVTKRGRWGNLSIKACLILSNTESQMLCDYLQTDQQWLPSTLLCVCMIVKLRGPCLPLLLPQCTPLVRSTHPSLWSCGCDPCIQRLGRTVWSASPLNGPHPSEQTQWAPYRKPEIAVTPLLSVHLHLKINLRT